MKRLIAVVAVMGIALGLASCGMAPEKAAKEALTLKQVFL